MSHKDRAELIFVSGPVGVGKTTFSYTLLHFLLSKGYSACYKSIVSFPLFSYIFFKFIDILIYGLETVRIHEKVNIHPSTLFVKKVQKVPRPIVLALTFLEALNITLSFYANLLSCINKKVIIIDEGIINILASYLEIFGENTFLTQYIVALTKSLQHYFNLRIVYLDVNDDVLLKRWIARGYPIATPMIKIDHHLRYTQLVRRSKTIISKVSKIIKIDSTKKSPYELIKEIAEGYY